jgi:hypothetical protein
VDTYVGKRVAVTTAAPNEYERGRCLTGATQNEHDHHVGLVERKLCHQLVLTMSAKVEQNSAFAAPELAV